MDEADGLPRGNRRGVPWGDTPVSRYLQLQRARTCASNQLRPRLRRWLKLSGEKSLPQPALRSSGFVSNYCLLRSSSEIFHKLAGCFPATERLSCGRRGQVNRKFTKARTRFFLLIEYDSEPERPKTGDRTHRRPETGYTAERRHQRRRHRRSET